MMEPFASRSPVCWIVFLVVLLSPQAEQISASSCRSGACVLLSHLCQNKDIDECANGTNECALNATCTNTIGSYTCVCNPGYTGNGRNCTDVNECATGANDCSANATCKNTIGSFTCNCIAGYVGNGTTCSEKWEPWSVWGPCSHLCIGGHQTRSKKCYEDYMSIYTNDTHCRIFESRVCNVLPCPIDKDECQLGEDDCSLNATCNNTVGSFNCSCNEGFVGDGRNCTDKDECQLGEDDCSLNATCNNTVGSFNCSCNERFVGDGRNCTDKNECQLGEDDCSLNATCNNIVGSFNCSCNEGFVGDGRNCTALPTQQTSTTEQPTTTTVIASTGVDSTTGGSLKCVGVDRSWFGLIVINLVLIDVIQN